MKAGALEGGEIKPWVIRVSPDPLRRSCKVKERQPVNMVTTPTLSQQRVSEALQERGGRCRTHSWWLSFSFPLAYQLCDLGKQALSSPSSMCKVNKQFLLTISMQSKSRLSDVCESIW